MAMFTLLVSWLLVACVPALLMLTASGLGRLERDLPRQPLATMTTEACADSSRPHDAASPAPRHTEPRGNPPFTVVRDADRV